MSLVQYKYGQIQFLLSVLNLHINGQSALKTAYACSLFQYIKKLMKELPSEKQYGILMHDEMTIRSDLVYDRKGDSIIGFVNPSSWTFNEKA